MGIKVFFGVLLALSLCVESLASEEGFSRCGAAFAGDAASSAPTGPNSNRIDLCFRSGEQAFFAVRYNQSRRMPDWVAYRLENTFGENSCASVPREHMRCHYLKDNVDSCIAAGRGTRKWPSDPFHVDAYLEARKLPRLSTNIFSGTGHDRGHLAPNNAFSWQTCGQYQTFSMANMTPQRARLNRNAWADLEAQELYWGVAEGPLYVVAGPIYRSFPVSKFQVFEDGTRDRTQVVTAGTKLKTEKQEDPPIPLATGYFRVIYKPAGQGSEAQAIGYLLPHTEEEGFGFWEFMSRIDVIEQASSLHFAIPDSLKGAGGQEYWLTRRIHKKWSVRGACPQGYEPQGWAATMKSAKYRVEVCLASSTN